MRTTSLERGEPPPSSRFRPPLTGLLAGLLAVTATHAAAPAGAESSGAAPAQAASSEPPRTLERELASERLRCAELEAEAGRLRRSLNQCEAAAALDAGPATARAKPEAEQPPTGAATPESVASVALTSAGLLLAAGFTLGLLAGHLLADWLQRRRHGGFRL